MAETGHSPAERGGNTASIFGSLIALACAAERGCGSEPPDAHRLSEARVQILRQWLGLGMERQAADLREYLRDRGACVETLLTAQALHDVVPSCALKAERLWFESSVEALIAIIRGEEALRRAPDSRLLCVLRLAYGGWSARLSAKTIATELGRSADHLTRRFRRYTGMPIGRYLKLLRMRAAFDELQRQLTSIHEIAALLGFSTPGNFIRWFRREFGMSPGEFRVEALAFMPGTVHGAGGGSSMPAGHSLRSRK